MIPDITERKGRGEGSTFFFTLPTASGPGTLRSGSANISAAFLPAAGNENDTDNLRLIP